MKKEKWIIAGIIVLIIIISFIYMSMTGMSVSAAKTTKGTINEFITEEAVTTLPNIYKISMPVTGRIEPITLTPGTKISKGQIIAQIDPVDMQKLVTKADTKVKAIQGQIEINKYDAIEMTGLKESEKWIATMNKLIAISKKKIEASKSVYAYAKEYESTLQKSGQAVSAIDNSEAKMQTATKKVDVETNTLANSAYIILGSIVELLPTYINDFITLKKLYRNVLKHELSEAQTSLDEAKLNLTRCKIKSPIDGVVLNRFISSKRYLPAGQVLMEVGNLNELEVQADILTEEAIDINKGDIVDIYGAAIGDIPIHGKVSRVDPKGFTKKSSLGVDQQRVHVKIKFEKNCLAELEKANKRLGDGYRLQVKIYTATKENVLKIPRTSLFKDNQGNWEVYAVRHSKARIQKVTLGLMNDNEAEVTKGLDENETVILAPSNTLADGTQVKCNFD